MPQYSIEREIAGAGDMTGEQLRDASKHANNVLVALGPDIQWVQFMVQVTNLLRVQRSQRRFNSFARKQIRLSGDKITPVSATIFPSTAQT